MHGRILLLGAAMACTVVLSTGLRARQVAGDTRDLMRRVAAYVERYYSRAQSIVAVETVTVQQVARDLSGEGFPRRFVYNLRVEWTPSANGVPDASLTRDLVTVNGRPPRPGDQPHCTAPEPITPEPLAMFLPQRQVEFIFDDPAEARLDGRDLLRLDYRFREPAADVVAWDRECVSMEFPSRTRGRVWIDPVSGEVLRIDEGATGPIEVEGPPDPRRRGLEPVVVFDRWNVSIRYRPVTFEDPDEVLLLPESIESLTMSRRGGTRRMQVYSNYRRFVTEGRVLP